MYTPTKKLFELHPVHIPIYHDMWSCQKVKTTFSVKSHIVMNGKM